MDPIGKDTADFIRACDGIHALLATGSLAPNDQALIELTCTDLLCRMTPEMLSPVLQGQRGLPYD